MFKGGGWPETDLWTQQTSSSSMHFFVDYFGLVSSRKRNPMARSATEQGPLGCVGVQTRETELEFSPVEVFGVRSGGAQLEFAPGKISISPIPLLRWSSSNMDLRSCRSP